MTNNHIIVVDFSGTLIKPFVAEKANLKRYGILGLNPPSEQDRKRHHGTKEHYDPLREFVGQKYGIKPDMHVQYQTHKPLWNRKAFILLVHIWHIWFRIRPTWN